MAYPWLYEFRTNVASQTGEDGVLAKIFERIGTRNRFCADLGAHDGYFISNTWNLLHNEGWAGLCIEADAAPFASLEARYAERADVHCLHAMATVENSLDAMLGRVGAPADLDLLSIDIDGMDLVLWKELINFRPRVVVIEANASMSPDIYFAQVDPAAHIGSSARALVDLARAKGYELAAHLVSNCVFVLREDFACLEIEDNSLEALFTSPFVPKVVSDLDGVHYLLKEGPWGFRGMVHSNDHTAHDTDFDSAVRGLSQMESGTEMAVNLSGRFGHIAALHYAYDIREVLRAFIERMKGYHRPG